MDRQDEKRDRADELTRRDSDRVADRRADEERDREPLRGGDILGLGGADVPKSPGDPSTEHDPESVARRRERATSGEQSVSDPADPSNQGGATGIDMGSGGQSTLLRRPKS